MTSTKQTAERCFASILIATDFSDESLTAFQTALRMASILHARLLVLHVFEYAEAASPGAGGIPEGLLSLRQSAECRLEELRRSAEQQGVPVQTIMSDGIVSLAILEAIEAHKIDLVVMGTKAARGLERLMIGSTAESVLCMASCPVLTAGPHVLPASLEQNPSHSARTGNEQGGFFLRKKPLERGVFGYIDSDSAADQPQPAGPVVFATGFDFASVHAFHYAAYLCRQTGSPLHCLHVLPQAEAENVREDEESTRQALRAALRRIVNENDLAISNPICAVSCNDDVSSAIVEYAKRHKADLIVTGARHAPAMAAHLPAGTTYRIIAEASCPVLTIAFDKDFPERQDALRRSPLPLV